jgi:hypothetical protein
MMRCSQSVEVPMPLYRKIFLLFFTLFARNAAATPELNFWAWFQAHEEEVFNFERNQEAVFDKLAAQMRRVNPSLTFEFGPKKGDKREFVISADGIKDAFPSVEKLYAAAPPLKKWEVIKFRPRRDPSDINYQGIAVRAASVTISIKKQGAKVALTVLIPGYIESRHASYSGIAFLFLDQAIGEYDVETRVGVIDVAMPSARYADAIPLEDLPATFDKLFGE